MGFFSDLARRPDEAKAPAFADITSALAPLVEWAPAAATPRNTRETKATPDGTPMLAPKPRVVAAPRGLQVHDNLIQGSEEWFAARCGMLTASEMKLIVTPTLKQASNEKERSHLYELLAQRTTKYVEPTYISDDMLRGQDDEFEVFGLYEKHFAPLDKVGFITNDKWGFPIGYSPDGIVGTEGLVEFKSRRQKFQVETFIVNVLEDTIPADFMIQIQTGLLVSERLWCDFLSYSGGLPLARIRAYPDDRVQAAILEAASAFEDRLALAHDKFLSALSVSKIIPTKRRPLDITL